VHRYKCDGCGQDTFEASEAHSCVGMTALHAAAGKGHAKACQWLLQVGYDAVLCYVMLCYVMLCYIIALVAAGWILYLLYDVISILLCYVIF
jgi:hypothetical protein